jgi:hypothetical protein
MPLSQFIESSTMDYASNEHLITEVDLGLIGGRIALTDKRVVATVPQPSSGEESVSLAHIGGVRAAHERSIKRCVQGAICIIIALFFMAGYRSVEARANMLVAQAEKRITDKGADTQEAAERIHVPGSVIALLGLPLLLFGAWRVLEGVRGRTELVIVCAGGSLTRTKMGYSKPLVEFGQDVGLQLAARD